VATPCRNEQNARAFRRGTIYEFTGIEASAVVLSDVDPSKPCHRDPRYARPSRANNPLVVHKWRSSAELVE